MVTCTYVYIEYINTHCFTKVCVHPGECCVSALCREECVSLEILDECLTVSLPWGVTSMSTVPKVLWDHLG